jgi:hypothetical protein
MQMSKIFIENESDSPLQCIHSTESIHLVIPIQTDCE